MNKIKSIAYAATSVILALPGIALATDPPMAWSVPAASAAGNLAETSFYEIIQTLLFYLLGLVGVLAVVGFVIAGIMYITAAGDEDRVESAKKMLTYSLIGIAVALIGLVIVIAVDYIIGGGGTAAPAV